VKKLIVVVAMVVTVLAVDVCALAQNSQTVGEQASQNIGQESESGDVSSSGSATSTGNSSGQCVMPLGFGNTGSLQPQSGVLQYNSSSGDISVDGSSLDVLQFDSTSGGINADGGSPMTFEPGLDGSCAQNVQQSSGASG
jgi:hypothetical protein